YSGAAYPIVKELRARMGGRLRLFFRTFPLTPAHPHAEQAAEAAEAAAAQGKFWEMHDVLYENQRHLGDQDLLAYAESLGLDAERFGKELAEHVHAGRVHEDYMSDLQSGVNRTPTERAGGRSNSPDFRGQARPQYWRQWSGGSPLSSRSRARGNEYLEPHLVPPQ